MNTKYYMKLLSRNDLGYRTTDPDGQPSNTQYILLHQGAFGTFFPKIVKEAVFDFNIFHKPETMQITIKSSPKVSHLALKKKFADIGIFKPNDIIVFEKIADGKYSITKISPNEIALYSKYHDLSDGGHFTNTL